MSLDFATTTGDYVETRSALFGLDSALSVSCWVKTGTTLVPYMTLVTKSTNSLMILGMLEDRRIFLFVVNDLGWAYPSAGAVPAGIWTHIAATYDDTANEARIYIGGVPDYFNPRTTAAVMSETSTPMRIGGPQDNGSMEGFEGKIQDVAVWNRVLEDEAIYAMGVRRCVAGHFQNGLTGWWPLHVPGDAVYDAAAVSGDLGLNDLGPSDNDMGSTIFGDPDWRTDSPGLIWPTRPHVYSKVPTASGGTVPPLAMYHFRRRRVS